MVYSQHLVIPDRSGARVLFLKDGSGWKLPSVTAEPDWIRRQNTVLGPRPARP